MHHCHAPRHCQCLGLGIRITDTMASRASGKNLNKSRAHRSESPLTLRLQRVGRRRGFGLAAIPAGPHWVSATQWDSPDSDIRVGGRYSSSLVHRRDCRHRRFILKRSGLYPGSHALGAAQEARYPAGTRGDSRVKLSMALNPGGGPPGRRLVSRSRPRLSSGAVYSVSSAAEPNGSHGASQEGM